ncbi:SusC/RagA family TonB-linked outer membrane protein [Sinomicrobium oceani]|uniref:SusC/RagA family TonB-linked outer membrane protein n=1 Tax=Sinomicrobium oceani TaxID=1150368 RepID=UPI00227AABE3|nr:SusC/RagA family TonB-linked outer membrane protein [Sinomicrobium oceani]
MSASPFLQIDDQHSVTGTVMDSNGEPLGGVNIVVSGKKQGTISDFDGTYSITASPQDTLVYSFVGFKTLKERVGDRLAIDVVMVEDVMALGEVTVNAGYYTVKERERTGSISKVTSKDIELQPVVNPIQALQGRMSGVEVVQPGGVPGAAARIQIRGRNSLGSGIYPLYIIDGVPIAANPIETTGGLLGVAGIDPLNTLNLSNIESIEVLKDADATAIYGSRGANGVVLITTKKSKEKDGKTSLDIRAYSGVGKVSNTMDLLSTSQYLEMRKEAFANDEATPTEGNAADLLLWDQNRYTDWQKELIGGTAYITDLQTSVSWGNAHTSFILGGSFHRESTVFPGNSNYRKVTGHLNLNHTSKDQRFRLTLSANYGVDKNLLFNSPDFVQNAILLPPNAPALYDEYGELNWENSTWTNPLSALRRPQEISTDNLMVNSSLNYRLLPGLNLKANLGYTNLNTQEMTKDPKSSYDPASQQGVLHSSQHRTTKRNSWIVEPQIVYSKKWGEGFMDAIAGVTFQKSDTDILALGGQGYLEERLIGNLNAADNVYVFSQEEIDYAYTAVFGRIGYNWKKKYFLNLTGRRDGSSRFGPNKRFASFGAVGGAWIFSEEPFMKRSVPFISFGKLRGSYGTTGSDQITDYGYYDTYKPTAGQGGLYPTGLTNPDYSWEVNKKLEAALELGFLEDRIRVSASWYRNRSSNQLIGYSLPATTGFTSVQANFPATVQNTGWELEWATHNIRSTDFNWKSSFNITYPQNKLLKFPDIEQTSYVNTYQVGEPLNIAFLYTYTGIHPETGLYEVADVNEDGRYDFDDRGIVKNLGRKYYGGFNNRLTYKNVQLEFLLEFVKQTGKANHFISAYPPGFGPTNTIIRGNVPSEVWDRWREPGNNTNIQRFTQSRSNLVTYRNVANSDAAYSDTSFLRLKTLSISYGLPQRFISRMGLEACHIYLHAQNLFTLTNYIGMDPQFPANTLPSLRMFTGGVQLKF